MRPSDSDFVLLHSRARQIESACINDQEVNALYWIELTRQCLDEIEKTVKSIKSEKESRSGVKVF